MRHTTVHSLHPSISSVARRRLTAACAASVMLLATTGCGDDSSSTDASTATLAPAPGATDAQGGTAAPPADPSAGADDACRLITPAEAEGVLGMPVTEGQVLTYDAQQYGTAYSCSYYSIDETSGPTTVSVSVLGSGYPRAEWEQASRAEDVTEVDGVGDVAFFGGNSMDVFVDGIWLQGELINTDEATQMDALSTILARAIERL